MNCLDLCTNDLCTNCHKKLGAECEPTQRLWGFAFRQRREPLPSMAYAVLTLLESIAGGRRKAASTFQIDYTILDTIGRLSSTKGDSDSMRKFPQGGQAQPLTGSESAWLEASIRRVIRRMGEHAAGVQLTQLVMNDLPQI